MRSITAIRNSIDLAELMNTHPPLTSEDAAETPLDWPGIGLPGGDGFVFYDTDKQASTATRLVLADGLAAVDYKTEWHSGCPMFDTMPEVEKPHWCPAVYESTTWPDADAVVTLDWLSVYVGQASFAETTPYASSGEAKQAYEREVAAMEEAYPDDEDEDC